MPLINLKSDLKSLRYGNDRPSGDSAQPYIQVDVNTGLTGIKAIDGIFGEGSKSDDGFIRGGATNALRSSLADTIRVGKFFTDLPKGPLFIAKQVGLQLSNPKLETNSDTSGLGKLFQPTRLYNLGINTLAQTAVNAFGIHFNRHGVLPVQSPDTLYENIAYNNNIGGNNRLVKLKQKLFVKSDDKKLLIDRYIAGPGSVYGIGTTTIRRYGPLTDYATTDKENFEKEVQASYYLKAGNKLIDPFNSNVFYDQRTSIGNGYITTISLSSLSNILDKSKLNAGQSLNKKAPAPSSSIQDTVNLNETDTSERKSSIVGFAIPKTETGSIGSYETKKTNTLPQNPLVGVTGDYQNIKNQIAKLQEKNKYVVSDSYEFKINDTTYTIRKPTGFVQSLISTARDQDNINLTPIFESKTYLDTDVIITDEGEKKFKDLVPFRIQAINSNNPSLGKWITFKAYLTGLDDNTNATWADIQYIGRGDKFYIYNGFTRSINVGFRTAAFSKEEMKFIYQKLNFLMSNLMPDHDNDSSIVMKGPLTRLTIGNWINSQLGVINNVGYTVLDESSWELDDGLILPYVIDVKMTFTPIGVETNKENKLAQKSLFNSNIAQNQKDKATSIIDGSYYSQQGSNNYTKNQ